MRGDVFSLVAVNVVSTPVGPADGHVQLEVEDLQYQYHLRKTAGTPIPIERQTEVSGLVDAIRNIRVRQYTDEEPLTTTLPKAALRSISPQASLGAHQRAAAHAEERLPSTAMSQDGAQSQSLHGSPVLQTQAPVATQVNPPPRKAKKGPSLAVEGFEMTTGLNLAKPSAPALDSTPQVVSNPKRTAKLLDLLGGPSKAPPLLSSAAPSVDVNIESEDQAPPNQPSRASRLSQVGDRDAESSSSRATKRRRVSSGGRDVRVPYARRKIPLPQQRLLDQKHSWYPPLPGQQFPTPNIPIELLQAWTSNGEESSRKPQQTSEVARQVSEDQQSGDHSTLQECEQGTSAPIENEVIEVNSSSSSSSSSDEELPESQWPPSQDTPPRPSASQKKRPTLPPDSTGGSIQTLSPAKARSSAPLHSPHKPSRNPRHSPALSSLGTPQAAGTQRLPHRSPEKPYTPSQPALRVRGDQYIPPYSSLRSKERPSSQHSSRSEQIHSASSQERRDERFNDTSSRRPLEEMQGKYGIFTRTPALLGDRRVNSSGDGWRAEVSTSRSQESSKERSDRSGDVRMRAEQDAGPQRSMQQLSTGSSDRRRQDQDGSQAPSSMPRRKNPDYRLPHSPDNRHQQPLNGKQHARGTSGRSGPGGVDARQASTSSPRSSGLATVIKGTQFSNEGSEMEVDVPRPLTDPREKHHAKRTQHFKGAQRKTW